MQYSSSQNGKPPASVAVIGAGPSGLTAALELTERGVATTVLEMDHIVGGISRTENYRGYRFDMGGHRFFTKSREVQAIWNKLLGDQFLLRPRLSRIYYGRKFFDYPLKPLNAIRLLGLLEGFRIVASFLRWQLFPHRPEESFEHWVTNRFGARLFNTFFRAYTEKVWGIPCSELKAEWAAQRIKDLSLRSVISNMISSRGPQIVTLIEQFHYPRLGPGMMWEKAHAQVEAGGGKVHLNAPVTRLYRDGNRITEIETDGSGRIQAEAFISSMPVTALVARLDPPAPENVRRAAAKLNYRSFLTVCLILDQPDLFPDNWIYIQEPDVTVGRIQNFKNWSPDMTPDPATSSLGMEYFCNEGDELWSKPDQELIELGKRELEATGLGRAADVIDGCVFRVPKSYPVYDSAYVEHLITVREFVDGLENLQTIGRNGLHRYNNQDHAMLTGIYAVRNLVDGDDYDLWGVNTDEDYHEQVAVDDPQLLDTHTVAEVLRKEILHLDVLAFGVATGAFTGGLLFLITLLHATTATNGLPLVLLNQYFPGYTVSISGCLVGALYGFVTGLIAGCAYAGLSNTTLQSWLWLQQQRFQLPLLGRIFDFIDRRRP